MRLRRIDDEVLELLLAVAVADADPGEVMPQVDGAVGWSPVTVAAFREFHRARYGGFGGPHRTVMYAVTAGDAVVGMIRMSRSGGPATVETGVWLGRSARGRGIGTAALRALAAEAAEAGAETIVANTTAANEPALRMLRGCGALLAPHEESGDRVDAVLAIRDLPPVATGH